jgi:arginine exporter protein ArgO
MGFVGEGAGASIAFAIGVIVGIVAWFSLLLLLIRRYSGRFTRNFLGRVVNAMGVVLMLIGGWFLVEPIHDLVAL